MTLHEVERLFAYWKIYPPLRDLVAAFIGFKPGTQEAEQKKYMTSDDMRRIMQMTGGKLPGMGQR